MAKRGEEKPANKFARLMRMAFREASIGNSEKARRIWKSMLKTGISPHANTTTGFEIAIAKGIHETHS